MPPSPLRKLRSSARLLTLTGSGHVTYAERPEEFATAVRDFAQQLGVLSDRAVADIGVRAAT
jgi:pimeloyl-ACP methyl ester carboxylesterase